MSIINGVFLIDKPSGQSSHDMVNIMRRKLNMKRVGHTGTLDPLASGLIIVLTGTYCRLCELIMETEKEYICKLQLGITSDTEDITGNILKRIDTVPSDYEVKSVINSFIGEIVQTPPMFSAIKRNGQKLYELARKGEVVDRNARLVFVRDIDIVFCDEQKGIYELHIVCGKGTYIRTICSDIGEKLGCGAVMTELRRTSLAGFNVKNALTIADIEHMSFEELFKRSIEIEEIFFAMPSATLNDKDFKRFRNGVQIDMPANAVNGLYRIYNSEKELTSIGSIEDNILKSKMFFK